MAEPIPTSVALGPKAYLDPQLSPDGSKISYLAPLDGVSNLWVQELSTGSARAVTAYRDQPLGGMFSYVSALGRSVWHRWAYDAHHVLVLRDQHGNELFHVHAIDLRSGESRDLTPYDNIQAVIVAVSPHMPDHVVVQMGAEDPTRQDLYRIRISDGHTDRIWKNEQGFSSWVLDPHLELVAAVGADDSGRRALVAIDLAGQLPTIFEQPASDGQLSTFGTDESGRIVLLTSAGGDRARLLLLDASTGETHEPFAADPVYDMHSPVANPAVRAVDLVRIARERVGHVAVPSLQAEIARLTHTYPDAQVTVVNRSLDDRQWLVELAYDDRPIAYAVWSRDTQSAAVLFEHLPALRDYSLAQQEPIEFVSHDGLHIRGYVMAPPDRPRHRLATVVLVHGGPAQRQLWGWGDPYVPMAQWFAARGYLVLLIDFRGSDGYGTSFQRAINREWGGKSLQDLLDAVDFAAAHGWTDPDRVAFWGVSFGGYTSLAAATFAPDRVRCAIPVAGISDLLGMVESVPPYWAGLRRHWVEVLGDPETEREFILSRSPISRVDDMTVPLLLIHGENDTRCTPAESQKIVDALSARGVPVEHLVLTDEGHVFTRPSSWELALDATEQFLARHLLS